MPRRYLRLKGSACRNRRYPKGSCCTWPREDDGVVSSDYDQSTLDPEEPKQESEGSYSVRWCRWCVGESEDLANFRIHDGITNG